MKRNIIINESQLRLLEKAVMPPGFRDKLNGVESEKQELEDYVERHGEYMTDFTNGKTYMVQYLKALSDLVGKDYAMCAPVKEDGTYGAFYVKPYASFIKKQTVVPHAQTVMSKPKPNLYRQLGLNK